MPDWLDSVDEWADFVQIVGLPLALLALVLAWQQLRKAARTGSVQIALALDASLSEFEDVRAALNQGKEIGDHVRLRRYIAAFERVGYALRVGEIALEEVHKFYASRFRKLAENQDALTITEDRDSWQDFHYLRDVLCCPETRQRADRGSGQRLPLDSVQGRKRVT